MVENIRRNLKIYPYAPGSFGIFEKINENVQNELAPSYDMELAPDERMKKSLTGA
jgi:hypothetical protein